MPVFLLLSPFKNLEEIGNTNTLFKAAISEARS